MSYKKGSDGLTKLLKQLKTSENDNGRASPLLWVDYVGKKIADNSTIADINKGYLVVNVYHPSFSQLVRLKEKDILKKIKVNYPKLDIKEIVVKVVEPPEGYEANKNRNEFGGFFSEENQEPPKVLKEKDSSFTSLLEKMKKRSMGEDV